MQKRLLCALVGIALLMILCMNVLAAYVDISVDQNKNSSTDIFAAVSKKTEFPKVGSASSLIDAAYNTASQNIAPKSEESKQVSSEPRIVINGVPVTNLTNKIVNHETYVSMQPFLKALDQSTEINWQNGQLEASGKGFHLTARPGDNYLVVNERYLYVPDGIISEGDSTMAPMSLVGNALGATTQCEVMTGNILVNTTSAPLVSGSSYYNSNDLHWLSRIISAESKNQPLKGKIAVGTVIMNRVESPNFPNTIYDVIFSGNQFTPVVNGSINDEPTDESVLAAKLVLEGAREAGKSLFFHQAGLNCWAAGNKAYVTTIADHSFYE